MNKSGPPAIQYAHVLGNTGSNGCDGFQGQALHGQVGLLEYRINRIDHYPWEKGSDNLSLEHFTKLADQVADGHTINLTEEVPLRFKKPRNDIRENWGPHRKGTSNKGSKPIGSVLVDEHLKERRLSPRGGGKTKQDRLLYA